MSYDPGQSNCDGRYRHFSYNDGNNQMQCSSQQFSWGSSQQGSAIQAPPQQSTQQTQGRVPMQQPFFGTAQLQQDHLALHQAGMQLGMQQAHSMMNAMHTNVGLLAAPPMMGPQPDWQPAIDYVQQPSPLQLPAPAQDQQLPNVPQLAARHEDGHSEYRREVIREAKKFDARLRQLEQARMLEQSQVQDKNSELAAARAQEQKLRQQLLESEQRHRLALSEVARSQATNALRSAPDFDMLALQKVIDEVQRSRILRDDIKKLVSDAVGAQVAGVAKSSDIESAASRIEKRLDMVPASASNTQVQQIVQDKLARAVRKFSKKAPLQQQRLIASQPQHEQVSVVTQDVERAVVRSRHNHRDSSGRSQPTVSTEARIEEAVVPFKQQHYRPTLRVPGNLAVPEVQQRTAARHKPGKAQELAMSQTTDQGVGLPDSFPDNTSQVSTWERQREPMQQLVPGSMVPAVQLWNDGRGPAPVPWLQQMRASPQRATGSTELVKQTKALAGKSRRS